MTPHTRQWLLKFAGGALHVSPSSLPPPSTDRGVGEFKREFLRKLNRMGFEVDIAFGNESTDVHAYRGFQQRAPEIYIIGGPGGDGVTRVSRTWQTVVAELGRREPVAQPGQPRGACR